MKIIALIIMTVSNTIADANAYSIGTPGVKWGPAEYKQWRESRIKERCYHTDVVPKVQALSDKYDVVEYGQLSYEDEEGNDKPFPLFAVRSKEWCEKKQNVMITGGVHGYETVSCKVFGVLIYNGCA